jgi:hypothetical protein
MSNPIGLHTCIGWRWLFRDWEYATEITTGQGKQRRLAASFVVDMVGYSRLMEAPFYFLARMRIHYKMP